jgi:hypothetical protein
MSLGSAAQGVDGRIKSGHGRNFFELRWKASTWIKATRSSATRRRLWIHFDKGKHSEKCGHLACSADLR